MKVLFVTRGDAFELVGGDTVQMMETKNALEVLGINVDIGLGEQPVEKLQEYDIIHLFGIQFWDLLYKETLKIKKINKKLVVSPIWFNFNEERISISMQYSKKLNLLRSIIGFSLTKKIYEYKINFIEKKKQRKILELADYILPNSIMECDDIKDYFLIKEDKIFVIYNGVKDEYKDLEYMKLPEEIENYGFNYKGYALQVGRIAPEKNTLKTINICIKNNIPLIIIGSKSQHPDYYDKCLQASYNGKVLILDYMPQDKIIPFYQNCKMHILPSFRETPGLVSLEAAIFGSNIVSTSIGSAKEYFEDRAFYCDPYNEKNIEDAIINAWKNKFNNLSELVKRKFLWSEIGKETLKIYNKIEF